MISTKNKILVARIIKIIICIFYKNTQNISVLRRGIRWKLDLNEGIDFSIFLLGCFEKGTVKALDRLIRKGDTVIDIGANIGAHTIHMAQKVSNNGRVFALEPTDFAFKKLVQNVNINLDLSGRIKLRQILLVDTDNDSSKEIYSSWPLINSHDSHKVHQGVKKTIIGASKIRLDDFISFENIDKVDLIKLDVDGNELEVLKGGIELINKFSPIFVMELAPDQYEKKENFDKVVELLISMGYRFLSLNEKIKLPSEISLLKDKIPKNGGINIVAKRIKT
jgi:FkbM family methyltransferase